MSDTPRTDSASTSDCNGPSMVRADFARALERENSALRERLTPKALADALVRNRIIQPEAIDLPEGYDGGWTVTNISALSAEILNTPEHQRESGASAVQPNTQPK